MKKWIKKYSNWQHRPLNEKLKGILLILFPLIFLAVVVFAPGWWAYLHFNYPIGIPYLIGIGLSIILFFTGFGLYMWTIILFAQAKGSQTPILPTQKLVTTGPYAHSRNPMVTGTILMILGIGISLDSWSFLVFGLIIPSLYILYIKFVEEKELEARFGESYKNYKKSTPFIFPNLFKAH
ncbi:isoprenylcysteine carboxylmethyltransferase family protein [Echinicola jeungdonensis]|uniref:Methyltransferase family protein n=1 Tax=Echinicola jeungdonensis TaxID=709343 RepID=A0ABV5J264_9BACT|nr:isoprenylcysteine carboxylmethyltransferase family protein [Echinicola jeungdonensis]MDN3669058.1 isoprenylcysteine carboxylmethyltransferase family protein [Echinicola jeungdonensis]